MLQVKVRDREHDGIAVHRNLLLLVLVHAVLFRVLENLLQSWRRESLHRFLRLEGVQQRLVEAQAIGSIAYVVLEQLALQVS